MSDRLAGVLDKHLLCGQATAGEMADTLLAAAMAERDDPGRAFLERQRSRHERFLATEMDLLCPDAAGHMVTAADIAVAISVLRNMRGRAVLPPPRKGRPLAWGRRWLWPLLAAWWCQYRAQPQVPVAATGAFVKLIDDVHGAFDRKLPDGSIVARAARDLNRNLGFWQALAPRFGTLAALYHDHL